MHGFQNLRVADTSIYPDNVMHNINLTAIAVGEKAARFIEQGSMYPLVELLYERRALSRWRFTIWSRETARTMTAPVTKVLQVASMPKKMMPLLIA